MKQSQINSSKSNENNNDTLINDIFMQSLSLKCSILSELSYFDQQSSISSQSIIEYNLIPSIKYYSNVLSELSEKCLLEMIYSQENSFAWKQLKTRRLQCWGGLPNIEDNLNNTLPLWLNEICNSFIQEGFFPVDYPPNHVLINEYQPGQGIIHHTDGPKYLNKVIIISLKSPIVMNFRPRLSTEEIGMNIVENNDETQLESTSTLTKNNNPTLNLILYPRSILYFTDNIYHNYLHGIEPFTFDDYSLLENLLNPPFPCRHSQHIPYSPSMSDESSIYYREKRVSLTIRHQFRSSTNE